MRFEWLALLAYKRLTVPGDHAWVELEEVARLPSWVGRPRRHIVTNVGRYIRSLELEEIQLVEAKSAWTGPYRLMADALSVEFDVPLVEARRRLQLREEHPSATPRDQLIRFTFLYERAQWLFFRGRLSLRPESPFRKEKKKREENARAILMNMVDEESYGMTLRLLACLSTVDVLYRLGQFRAARETLLDNESLLRSTPDFALKARFYVKLAWAFQRAETSKHSDRLVEKTLRKASYYAENSGDRDSLGLWAHRAGGYLTKKKRHLEAVDQYLLALEAFLITGNHDMVQATCANLGSALHRIGSQYYPEVREWLLVSIAIARWMRLGRDDAHAEMILAKMYAEEGNAFKSRWFLRRAQRIAETANSRVNLADIFMMWGLWHRKFGRREDAVRMLRRARRIYRKLSEFDVPQKEKYMERKFPEVWMDVLERDEAIGT
jgi:tetratricopeptide (TPR) repeat protein